MKKILILYSATGGGHLRAAEALKEELKRRDSKLKILLLDGLEETSLNIRINPSRTYLVLTTKYIFFFNFFYLLSNNLFGVKVLRSLIKIIWGIKVSFKINKISPDYIISTHHFLTPSTIPMLKKDLNFFIVVTDLGRPHIIWFDKKASKIITPTSHMKKWTKTRLNIPNIFSGGYPVKRAFFREINKNTVINKNILILGGASGTGRLEKMTLNISHNFPDHKVNVICGHNHKLQVKLANQSHKNVAVYGFVNNMALFMKKADIVITKAGPGVIAECWALNKPLIVTSWVGRQEKENVAYLLKNRLGVVCQDIQSLASTINKIYQRYSVYARFTNPRLRGTSEIINNIFPVL